jgi:hypothetical protein
MARRSKGKSTGCGDGTLSFTAQTLLADLSYRDIKRSLYSILGDIGDSYGHIKRSLFKDSVRFGNPPISFKNEYLRKFGITARQFNAIRFDLDGNIRSAAEVLNRRIENLEDKVRAVKKWLKRQESLIRKIRKNADLPAHERSRQIHQVRFMVHHKSRKLYSSEMKLASLKDDLKHGRLRICFGSRPLFRKQFSLHDTDYVFHDEWLSDWKEARSSQSFCLGSKDENKGNQTCALFPDGTLRVRIPKHLQDKYGRHIVVPSVRYSYGQNIIDQALANNEAITHRFVRKDKRWYVHTTVEISRPRQVSFKPREIGVIGVDVNEKEVAVSETDRSGNLVWSKTCPACVKDRSTGRTMATYGDICALIADRAVKTGKPIGHETLDFRKKKASLKEQGVGYARMLSGFAYGSFLSLLDRRAFKSGIGVFSVNPAYTTVIGTVNYLSRYGLTCHEAAAFVIARRVQGYSESPAPARTASPLPVRNRGEHVWKFWGRLKGSGAWGGMHRLQRRRPLQGSTGCAEPHTILSHGTTAQTLRPPTRTPAGRYKRSPLRTDNGGLCESGCESLTLIGSNTVRLPL